MLNKLKERQFYFFTFFITFTTRMLKIGGSYPIRVALDDIGMLSGAAYFAGYDWSEVVSTTKYYGIGWYSLFAPVLRFVDSPTAIWLILIVANIAAVAIASVFSHYIGIKYLEMPNNLKTSLIAVVSTLAVMPDVSMSQESVLYCLTWIIAYLLIKSIQEKKSEVKRCLYILFMVLFCIYAYLIHTRAVVFLLAIPLALVMIQLIQKKINKKWLIYYAVSAVIMYFLADNLKAQIIDIIWGNSTSIMNAELPISSSLSQVFSLKGIRVVFDCVIGNLFTASMKLYGIPCIIIAFMLVYFINIFKKNEAALSTNNGVLLLFSGICFLIGVAGVAVIWGQGAIINYWTDEVNLSYKGFAYFRYYATFLGPAIFAALAVCCKEDGIRTQTRFCVVGIQGFIIIYWLTVVLEKISRSEYAKNAFNDYARGSFFKGDALNCVLSIEVTLLVLCIILFAKKYNKLGLIGAIIFNVLILSSGSSEREIFTKPQLNENADGGYYLVRQMEEDGIEFGDIYSTNTRRSYFLQFYLKEKPIRIGVPDTGAKNLVFSPFYLREAEELDGLPADYKCIIVDKNEYVWTNDQEIYDYILDVVTHDIDAVNASREINTNMFYFSGIGVDESGCVMYGPYITLNPGSYEVMFQLSPGEEGVSDVGGVLDVVCDYGETLICSAGWDGSSQFVTLNFQLEELTDNVEFRYLKDSGYDAVPTKVVLSNLWEGEISKTQFEYEEMESEEAGYVMSGPYIDLEPGTYEVIFFMNSLMEEKGKWGTLEVSGEKGENIICSQNWDGNSGVVTLNFQLDKKTEDIEFRYFKNAGNDTLPIKVVLHNLDN